MSYNIVTTRQAQVVIDEAALTAIRTDLARRMADLQRLQIAIETLAQVNEADRFAAAAMALCNQLASRYKAERASLGFLKGRYVRLSALSHTEKFTRQMRLVQDIEASMEECLDQDVEILHPQPADAAYVSRSTETLATRHGPNVICSLPLRRKGEVVGVITLERKAERPFVTDEVETLRLTCEIIAPRLINLHEQDRWFGARAAAATRHGLALLVGPKHTWIKAAVIGITAFVAFAIFAKGTHRVQSPFTFEPIEKEVIAAPFDGVLKSVYVLPGDVIVSEETARQVRDAGNIAYPLPNPFALGCLDSTLAVFDTTDLRDQLASAAAERNSHLKQRDIYSQQDGKTADAQVEAANAEKVQAQMDTLEYKIHRASIQAPLDGIVFTGDLKAKIGTRMNVGDPLFEVGDPSSLRAELSVPEDDANYLHLAQSGELATASYPGQKIEFKVETIFPVAEPKKDQNVVTVRAKLVGQPEPWMRPGMEGVAKVDVGRERFAWLWTRRLVNWVRMKLWF